MAEGYISKDIIKKTVNVTFDSDGKGRFTCPEGYKPISAYLDINWCCFLHSTNLMSAHSRVDYATVIKSTTTGISIIFTNAY